MFVYVVMCISVCFYIVFACEFVCAVNDRFNVGERLLSFHAHHSRTEREKGQRAPASSLLTGNPGNGTPPSQSPGPMTASVNLNALPPGPRYTLAGAPWRRPRTTEEKSPGPGAAGLVSAGARRVSFRVREPGQVVRMRMRTTQSVVIQTRGGKYFCPPA